MTSIDTAGALSSRVLVATGAAPYLGGPSTWELLRLAAPEIAFSDLDLLGIPPGDDYIAAVKRSIQARAEGCDAIVAHGSVAGIVLEAIRDARLTLPVLLLSPAAITRDTVVLRALRALLKGPVGELLASFAQSKRRRLVRDADYVRKQLALIVGSDAITPNLVQEAQERIIDPRTEAFCARTPETLLTLLTPTTAFEDFRGTALFGTSLMDRKAQKRIAGKQLDAAWSAPMLETPQDVADTLRTILQSRSPVTT